MHSVNIMKFGYICPHRVTYVSIQYPIQTYNICTNPSTYPSTDHTDTYPHAHLHVNGCSLDTYSLTSIYVPIYVYSHVSMDTFMYHLTNADIHIYM